MKISYDVQFRGLFNIQFDSYMYKVENNFEEYMDKKPRV